MKTPILFLTLVVGLISTYASARDQVVLLDISHEERASYIRVSPDIFTKYQDVVENQLGAKLVVNETNAIDSEMLDKADVLILLSSLNGEKPQKDRSAKEVDTIVRFVEHGGKLGRSMTDGLL